MFNALQQIINRLQADYHYKNDQKGIMKRFIAEGDNWNVHLFNAKDYIMESLPPSAKSIAVLGSGWLLDVPMDSLLKNNIEINLFDISHPQQIRNKYKNNEEVKFITADLTNGLVDIAKKTKSFGGFLNDFERMQCYEGLKDFDFVVSLNLLNQLDILLCDLLKIKFKIDDVSLLDIRKRIQQFHVNSLPKNKSCIITDYEEVNYRNSYEDGSVSSLIYIDLSRLKNTREWHWNFDTLKSYKNDYCTMFNVIAGLL